MIDKVIYFGLGSAVCVTAFILFNNNDVLANKVSYVATSTPTCVQLDCVVEKRAREIHQRDQSHYMEQSRLKALQELNLEMQDMTYNSPYVN